MRMDSSRDICQDFLNTGRDGKMKNVKQRDEKFLLSLGFSSSCSALYHGLCGRTDCKPIMGKIFPVESSFFEAFCRICEYYGIVLVVRKKNEKKLSVLQTVCVSVVDSNVDNRNTSGFSPLLLLCSGIEN